MEKSLIFLFGLLVICCSEQLVPFIAWSNSDILDEVQPPNAGNGGLDEVVNSLMLKLKDKGIQTVVIFTLDELSFDEFNKHTGVYHAKDSSSGYTQLQTSLENAESGYWTGVSVATEDWISQLAAGMDKTANYITAEDTATQDSSKFDQQIAVIKFSDWSNQDTVIGSVMQEINGMTYLAIYTQSVKEPHSRSRRDLEDELTKRQQVLFATEGNQIQNKDCPIGGVFNSTSVANVNNTNPCLLACVSNITINGTLDNGNWIACTLENPDDIKTCCSKENYTVDDECYYAPSPYMWLNYSAYIAYEDVKTTGNNCSTGNGSFVFNVSSIEVYFTTKIMFPQLPNNDTWNVSMETTVDVSIDNVLELNCSFNNMQRQHPNRNLYTPFSINEGLSYACSSEEYNRYMQVNFVNETLSPMCNESHFNVTFSRVQFQPYFVSNERFASADNCEGYTTPTIWMGIVTVVILLLILYVSMMCVFSMKTVDKFEDPRGQSINVEKLH